MSIKSTALSVVLLAAAILTPIGGAVADAGTQPCRDAPETPVTTGAVFNNPAEGDPTAVVRQVCNLVHQTPGGAQIRIAMFVVSGAAGLDFATEIVRAHRRGVNVQMVVDGWQADNYAVNSLKEELGTDRSASSWIHVCTGLSPEGSTAACIGNKGMHNKFYLFSQTGGATEVVVQSSANFTDLNSRTYWNNAVTLVGNTRLYEAYGSYFADLAAERRNDDYYRVVTTGMPGGSVRSHFFPRAGSGASTDTIVESLEKVDCSRETAIRIGMSEWDDYRISIAHELRELALDGCTVQIVYGKMDAEFRQVLVDAGIELRKLGSGSLLPGYVHSKYMIIEGSYNGETDAKWVFTGSPNYNETSLRRNDEAMLRINVRDIYDQYLQNFLAMRSVALPG